MVNINNPNLTHLAAALTLASTIFVAGASAQTPISPSTPLVNEYVEDTDIVRSEAWWNALGRQLALEVDVSDDKLDVSALQNIIFFASHHRDRVNLRDATPRLVEIYREHDNDAFRLMAVAALDAIGDARALRSIKPMLLEEESERVRHVTIAALERN